MKTPLVVVIAIVVGILGFLLVYSQQRDLPGEATQAKAVSSSTQAAGGGSATPENAVPVSGSSGK